MLKISSQFHDQRIEDLVTWNKLWEDLWINKLSEWWVFVSSKTTQLQQEWKIKTSKALINSWEHEKYSDVNCRVKAGIIKWIEYANKYKKDTLKVKLESLEVLDGKIKIPDWTIVKTWYPNIEESPEKWIFIRKVRNLQWEQIKAVYFQHKQWLKDYCKEVWCRIPNDKEYEKIFNQISEKWDENFTKILVDVLWIAFSGFRFINWEYSIPGIVAVFLSSSLAHCKDDFRCCLLDARGGNIPRFNNNSCEYACWVLFVEGKKITD
jgi:hypothetical protein